MAKQKFIKIILFLTGFLMCMPTGVEAAVLYFDPGEAEFGPGDEFAVDIKLQVNTSCVNTVEGVINFPREKLVLKEFVTGESILSLWIDYPRSGDMPEINRSGGLRFSGGIPGGYCGQIPGDPGDSNILGKLIFAVPRFTVGGGGEGRGRIVFGQGTRVLRNDGLGTEDALATRTAEVIFVDKQVNPDLDWDRLLARDITPPEPFVIELRRDPEMFGGDYYLIFSTVDKQSGVDRYEVLELRPGEEAGAAPELSWWKRLVYQDPPVPEWQTTRMPYRLNDQSLKSIVKVKAIDKAGNERLVEYVPPAAEKGGDGSANRAFLAVGLAVLGLLVVITIILWIILRKIKRKPHVEEN